jgi:hypothetical protein
MGDAPCLPWQSAPPANTESSSLLQEPWSVAIGREAIATTRSLPRLRYAGVKKKKKKQVKMEKMRKVRKESIAQPV